MFKLRLDSLAYQQHELHKPRGGQRTFKSRKKENSLLTLLCSIWKVDMHSLEKVSNASEFRAVVYNITLSKGSIDLKVNTHTHNRYSTSVFFPFSLSLQFDIDSPFSLLSCLSRSLSRPSAGAYEHCVCTRLGCVCMCVRASERACVHLKGLVKRKEKVTKESMCICYSLSAVLLTLQTPPDGFLVNVKRAGATDWFLWHAQKAFSCSYLHSFHPQAVKCILYCVAQACVCARSGEKDHALFKPLLSEDVC